MSNEENIDYERHERMNVLNSRFCADLFLLNPDTFKNINSKRLKSPASETINEKFEPWLGLSSMTDFRKFEMRTAYINRERF